MLFAIGDVHGHFDKLLTLMKHCRAYANDASEAARFILLGDYVDRGPASRDVLTFLATRPPHVQAIMGNHEAMMIEAVDDARASENWYRNGGFETLKSYGAMAPAELPARHIDLVRGLPLFIDDGIRLFVHAGIDPANPPDRDPDILLWTRKHAPDTAALPRFIVHGHTPTSSAGPDLRPNRLNLDTGAGWGRRLTAAAFRDDEARPLAFVDDLGQLSPVEPPDYP